MVDVNVYTSEPARAISQSGKGLVMANSVVIENGVDVDRFQPLGTVRSYQGGTEGFPKGPLSSVPWPGWAGTSGST